MIPRVAASESGEAQTHCVTARWGLKDSDVADALARGTALERAAVGRESRVPESECAPSWILSRAGPEKPCLNPAAPSAKAEYSRETDSGPVP